MPDDQEKKTNLESEDEANTSHSELEELKAKCEEYLSGWQRARADFSNYRRDEAARLEEIARFSNQDLIKDLIVVLDNFDLALQTMEKKGEVEKGVYMIRTQILDSLKKRGLEKISATIGEGFDPATQEAIALIPSDKPDSTVLEEVEAGYTLHGKVIRPIRVKVSRAS
ncbi:MAG: nucleotide exchange factor GrpE [Anaplasmataceae bacterium]|nr:nucleotide exchange factor GrpE [Anaplasmataceae bacterium]